MVIQHNIMSIFAYSANRRTVGALKEHLEKLSSGYRINRSADDAAGLAVSERIRAKVTELDRCQRNAAEGMDLARTADAALAEVSDMLKRARSLCIQAENGTYSSQELASISGEMNQLFSEIERIAKGSTFNTIRLFQGQVPGFEPPFHYEYDEVFSPSGDALQIWGNMSFIKEEDFDVAEKAKGATATFKLDDDIDLDDIHTLNGRSITISYPRYSSSSYMTSKTFYFTDGSSPTPSGSTEISLKDYYGKYITVEQALGRISYYDSYYSTYIPQTVKLDRVTRTVTMTAGLKTLSHPVNGSSYSVTNGNGSWANGKVTVGNPAGAEPLDPVDGVDATDNKPIYSDTVTATLTLSSLPTALTQENVNDLNRNTFYVNGSPIALSKLNASAGNTRKQVAEKLIAEIKKLNTNYDASYDESTNRLSVVYKNRSTSSSSSLSMYEHKIDDKPAQHKKEYSSNFWPSSALGVQTQVTLSYTPERAEEREVTISVPSGPFSFRVGSYDYLYYDSSQCSLTDGDYNLTEYTTTPDSGCIIDTNGKTQEEITADVINRIASRLRYSSGVGDVKVDGNKITVVGRNKGAPVSVSLSGYGNSVRPYKLVETASLVPGTSYVLSSSSSSYSQKVYVPFTLPEEADISTLAGRGFSVGGHKFEFVHGAGTGKNGEYRDIDISGCTTYDQLQEKVQAALNLSSSYNRYTAEIDKASKQLRIGGNSYYVSVTVTDGNAGVKGVVAGGGAVAFSNGTDAGHSQKAIDFSSIQTRQDLESLLGKGFRINCATCSGEYINVFFCWKKSGDIPLAFDRPDPETGEIRTIHNIPVELSKISNASSIVRSIVDQVAPSLKHYTDVAVGDKPTILLAQDKRRGDVTDYIGKIYLGKVLSGVEANFTYGVGFRKVLDDPEDADKVVVQDLEVKIYVGSDPKAQFIPIHLPHLDLQTLKLGPEGGVDLTDPGQSASDWLARVDRADLAISNARGTIGADYNRLEHAIQDLSNSHIQLSDALSVIRDADMAQLMMAQVKDQILLQAQQSMMVQANQSAQGVLQLMH